MKEWHDIPERVMKRRAIKAVTCDCCGAKAEGEDVGRSPDWSKEPWMSHHVCITITTTCDGDVDSEGLDLCYECANWLWKQMTSGKIVRPK